MNSRLDLDRIAKQLAVAGSTSFDGEAVTAVRMVDRELRKAGIEWIDLVNPSRELAVADEANAALLAEILELRKELDDIRSRGGRDGGWVDVTHGGNVNATAQWALDLAHRGVVDLTEREMDFLGTCRHWHGRLTPKMNDWFVDLIAKITGRTGYRPPA